MKITKNQLRKLIRESLQEAKGIGKFGDPLSPEQLADIERRDAAYAAGEKADKEYYESMKMKRKKLRAALSTALSALEEMEGEMNIDKFTSAKTKIQQIQDIFGKE